MPQSTTPRQQGPLAPTPGNIRGSASRHNLSQSLLHQRCAPQTSRRDCRRRSSVGSSEAESVEIHELKQPPVERYRSISQEPTGDCSCGIHEGPPTVLPSLVNKCPVIGEETSPRGHSVDLRRAEGSEHRGSKACRSSSRRGRSRRGGSRSGESSCEINTRWSSIDKVCNEAPRSPLFRSVGVHSLSPKALEMLQSPGLRRGPQQKQQEQQDQQSTEVQGCDVQPEKDEAKEEGQCSSCGIQKANAPSGFAVVQSTIPLWGQLRKAASIDSRDAEGSAGHGGPLGLPTVPGCPRRVPSCEDCGCLLPGGATRPAGPYQLLRHHQHHRESQVVAGGVQWGQPTSFWVIESEKDDGVEREFRRLFRVNSPESRIALSSFRMLLTLMVVFSAIKYGISTYFPPANHTAFVCLFGADVLIWSFFSCEAALRCRALGLRRFLRDQQCLFDTALQLVGLAALALRVSILLNVGGLGTRVFEPNPLERTDGIVNDFTIGDAQIALVALDTIQLTRVYRLAFSCRELFFLTRSILHSLRSLLWTALFVLVVIYTCAIFCTWAYYDEDDPEMRLLWGNLVLSMFTLFTVLTLEGWNNVATATAEKHPFSRIFFVGYICFTTLTLLNIVTGIILDAYVDMSNRLLKEANYKDDLEKDLYNEKLLMSAFEKTSFLVCLRPAVSTVLTQGTTYALASSDPTPSVWAAGDATQDSTVPGIPREGETTTGGRYTGGSSVINAAAASASQSPRTPLAVATAGALLERKLTGLTSEDSTARPSTESAVESEPLQVRAHIPETVPVEGITVRTCVKYLRVGGHQPMDILRHPIVQGALQAARIPFYQAFDVLSMYHQRGIQFVTGCKRNSTQQSMLDWTAFFRVLWEKPWPTSAVCLQRHACIICGSDSLAMHVEVSGAPLHVQGDLKLGEDRGDSLRIYYLPSGPYLSDYTFPVADSVERQGA
ncbi:hypothetical protein cyc_01887 [Cyclospora cayetanensis]|uniref:Ion transport domain-containing protein n=1 Tax=Cyclospora cayetanensis TaxID=88456 RepID=A0A1D3D0P0_9EIME|nr:hypothetical protein cyc_01887 [Cyclospora cayetanensis]